MSRSLLLIILSAFFFNSCEIINPSEQVPAYVKIDAIAFKDNPDEVGSTRQKIEYVWFYLDEDLQGVYELPAYFPVLKLGKRRVRINGGVKMNGISATKISYPFFDFNTKEYNLEARKTLEIKDTIRYIEDMTLIFKEDFDVGLSFENMSGSLATMQRTTNTNQIYEGTGSGIVELNNTENFFKSRMFQSVPIKLPGGGSNVFLELDYKNDVSFTIGLASVQSSGEIEDWDILSVNPKTNWNKIYINFTNAVSYNQSAVEHYFYVKSSLPEGQSTGTLFFDNFKLIY